MRTGSPSVRARSIARRSTRRGVAEPAGRAERPTEPDEQVGARLPAADVVGVDELERALVRRDRVLVGELRVEAVGRPLAVQHGLERVAGGRGLGEVVRALGEEPRVPFAVQLLDRFTDAAVQPDAAQRREAVDQRLAHQLVREPEVARGRRALRRRCRPSTRLRRGRARGPRRCRTRARRARRRTRDPRSRRGQHR